MAKRSLIIDENSINTMLRNTQKQQGMRTWIGKNWLKTKSSGELLSVW
jgi:hypothetical protein